MGGGQPRVRLDHRRHLGAEIKERAGQPLVLSEGESPGQQAGRPRVIAPPSRNDRRQDAGRDHRAASASVRAQQR